MKTVPITQDEMVSIGMAGIVAQYAFGAGWCELAVTEDNKEAMEHVLELRDEKELDAMDNFKMSN